MFWTKVKTGLPATAAVAVTGISTGLAYVLVLTGVIVKLVALPSLHWVSSLMYRDIVADVFSG